MTQPVKEFGKRKPQPAYEEPPSRKRSNQVALFLMGTMAIGGGAYALMPGNRCDLTDTMTTEQRLQCQQQNSSSSSSSGHGYYGGSGGGSSGSSARSNFASTDSSSSSSGSHSSPSGGSSSTSRGGFGSFASHFSGGG